VKYRAITSSGRLNPFKNLHHNPVTSGDRSFS
jgi:hypothetical protein